MKRLKKATPKYWWFVDAGFAKTGITIIDPHKKSIEVCGSIILDNTIVKGAVMSSMSLMVQELTKCYLGFNRMYPVEVFAAEMSVGGAQSASALRSMTAGVSVISSFVATVGCLFYPVSPTEVKNQIPGSNEKKHIIQWMRNKYPDVLPKTQAEAEHAADSLAVMEIILNNLKKYPGGSRLAKSYDLE